MEQLNLSEMIDHQRWLMNNGLFTDSAKDTLYLYGTLVHRDVFASYVQIDANRFNIHYCVYLPTKVLKSKALYDRLLGTDSLIGLWRLRRLLKREGNLDFLGILRQFVGQFCGNRWSVTLELKDAALYEGEDTVDVEGQRGSDADPGVDQ